MAQIAEETAEAARSGDQTVSKANESIGRHQAAGRPDRQPHARPREEVPADRRHPRDHQRAGRADEHPGHQRHHRGGGRGRDAGKRFAVVADEIRKLADRVGGSTKEIRALIEEIRAAVNTTVMATEGGTKAVDAGTRQFSDVATAFKQIVEPGEHDHRGGSRDRAQHEAADDRRRAGERRHRQRRPGGQGDRSQLEPDAADGVAAHRPVSGPDAADSSRRRTPRTMAKDPYRYFRVEARELLDGLTQGVLELEKGSAAPGARRAPAAPGPHAQGRRARGQAAGDRGAGARHRGHADAPPRVRATLLRTRRAASCLRLLDEIGSQLRDARPAQRASSTAGPARQAVEEPLETVRVEIQEMDSLLRGIAETGVQLGAVRKAPRRPPTAFASLPVCFCDQLAQRAADNGAASSPRMARARVAGRGAATSLERFSAALQSTSSASKRELAEIRDVAQRLRLIPGAAVFPSLARAVRDAAQALGKRSSSGLRRRGAARGARARGAARRAACTWCATRSRTDRDRGRARRSRKAADRACSAHGGAARRAGSLSSARDDGRGIDVEAVRRGRSRDGLVPQPRQRRCRRTSVIALLSAAGESRPRATSPRCRAAESAWTSCGRRRPG